MYRAHTYSVVARDPRNGDLGVAVQSHWFNVGRIVPWLRPGVGAVATQSMVEVAYGPRGLDLMGSDRSAPEALAELLAADADRELRQVAMIDASGRVGVHTGSRCIAAASHQWGDGWSVQANIMRSPSVVPAMAETFQGSRGPLADRLLATLQAAEETGGDLRGSQSAALIVVGDALDEPLMDLRVEDHADPIGELTRLVAVAGAYDEMNRGDEALGSGDIAEARRAYSAAAQRHPTAEVLFWQGIGLAEAGSVSEGKTALAAAISANPDMRELLRRLPETGLLDEELAAQLDEALDTA